MAEKGKVRIIAGQWKRSLLDVVDVDGVRPTGSRQRETLFNWIENYFGSLEGKKALDLYAGSGALAFEWISRGGASALLIEKNRQVAAAIEKNIQKLKAESVMKVVLGDSFVQLGILREKAPFDMVFIDPPFALNLQLKAANFAKPYMALDGLAYLESPTEIEDLQLKRIGVTAVK